MPAARKLTALQVESIGYVAGVDRTGGWARARTAGERVTLASLETRGWLERRAWRGDGISRDSAFEYRLAPIVRAELERRRAGTSS